MSKHGRLLPGQKWYMTQLRAVCAVTGDMKTFIGPDVPAISFEDADNYCQAQGLGYCRVIGVLVSEQSSDCSCGIDYETPTLN